MFAREPGDSIPAGLPVETFGASHSDAYLTILAVLVVFIGKMTVGWVTPKTFYTVITWALLIIGLELVIKVITGADPLLTLIRAIVR